MIYFLQASVSRSSESCFKAFSMSATTVSTPLTCEMTEREDGVGGGGGGGEEERER